MLFYSHESVYYFDCSTSVVRWGRILPWGSCHRRRRDWFDSGDMPYRLFHGRISPHENVTKMSRHHALKGIARLRPQHIMKTLFTAEANFKSGCLETDQKLSGLEKAQSGDCAVGRPFLVAYRRPVQSGQWSVRGCDESDFMKSQLG
jgi:hypothetical protein